MHVAFTSATQIPLDIAHTVDSVGCNPAEGHVRRDPTGDHPGSDLRLRRETDIGRHMRRLHTRRIVGPAFRQVKRAVDERMPVQCLMASTTSPTMWDRAKTNSFNAAKKNCLSYL
jgi:hypothetical protein